MDCSRSEFDSLRARLARLERQNRYMRVVLLILSLICILSAVSCESRPKTIEAQRFVMADKNGQLRAEIAMTYDFGPKGNPVIRLFDERGKELTTIGAGVLTISGEKGQATLLSDQLQMGVTALDSIARLEADGSLLLLGKHGTVLMDSGKPVLEVTDDNGFRADLGSNDLVTPTTGSQATTSAATLMLSTKDGKIIWSSPR